MTIQPQLDQVLADMQGTADEARELIKEAEKRWYYVRSPSEESATLAGQIALGNERLNLLSQWIEKISAIRAAVGGEAVAWMLRRKRDDFVRGCYATKPTAESMEFAELDGDYYTPLYASPTATVDVGAIRELLNRIRPGSEVAPWVYNELAALIGKEA